MSHLGSLSFASVHTGDVSEYDRFVGISTFSSLIEQCSMECLFYFSRNNLTRNISVLVQSRVIISTTLHLVVGGEATDHADDEQEDNAKEDLPRFPTGCVDHFDRLLVVPSGRS